MLKKLLKSKKSSYFLEIDEKSGQDNGKAPETASKPAKTAKTVEEKPSPQAKAEKAPKKAPKKAPQAPKTEETAQPPQAKTAAQPAAAKPQPKQRKEFATRYLMPNSPTPRRRPGANMQSFLDMAKDTGMRR